MEQVAAASLRLADRTSTAIAVLWSRHLQGRLTRTEFIESSAALVAGANTQAVALADLGLAAEIARTLNRVTPPLGLTPTGVQVDETRIADAIDRVLQADIESASTPRQVAESRRARAARFGADETLLTVAVTTHTAMAGHGVERWVRVTDPNPCVICVSLADGKARRVDTPMRRHRGCACIARPVLA